MIFFGSWLKDKFGKCQDRWKLKLKIRDWPCCYRGLLALTENLQACLITLAAQSFIINMTTIQTHWSDWRRNWITPNWAQMHWKLLELQWLALIKTERANSGRKEEPTCSLCAIITTAHCAADHHVNNKLPLWYSKTRTPLLCETVAWLHEN